MHRGSILIAGSCSRIMAGETAQWLRVLAVPLEDLIRFLGFMLGSSQLSLSPAPGDPTLLVSVDTGTHPHIHIIYNK